MNIIRDSKTKEDFVTLEYIFKVNQFLIPSYQRMYEWEKTEIKFLWDDLYSSFIKYKESDNNYFMGIAFYDRLTTKVIDTIPDKILNYVDTDNKKLSFLSDGQQRFTSFTLLLSAIFKVANRKLSTRELSSEDRDTLLDITDKLKLVLFVDGNSKQTRIVPVSSNGDLQNKFQNVISKDYMDLNIEKEMKNIIISDSSSEISNTMNRFEYSHLFFLDKIKSKFNYGNGFIEDFKKFTTFLLSRSTFILVERDSGTSNETREFFNKLNSRGKKLDDITILKNELYSIIVGKESEGKIIESDFNDIWETVLSNYSNKIVMEIIKLKVKKETKFTDDIERKKSFKNSFKESGYDLNGLIDFFKEKPLNESIKFFKDMKEKLNMNIWKYSMTYSSNDWKSFIEFIDINESSKSSSNNTQKMEHELKIFMSLTGHEVWRLLREKVIRTSKKIDGTNIKNFNNYVYYINTIIKRLFVLTSGKVYVSKYENKYSTFNKMKTIDNDTVYEVEDLIKVYDRSIFKLYKMNPTQFSVDELYPIKKKQMDKTGMTEKRENDILKHATYNFGAYANYDLLKKHKLMAPLLISQETDKLIKSLEVGNWDVDHIFEINEHKDNFNKNLLGLGGNNGDKIDLSFNLHPLPNSINRKSSKENSSKKEEYYIEKIRYYEKNVSNIFTQHISELLESYKGSKIDIKKEHNEMIIKLAEQLKRSINLPG